MVVYIYGGGGWSWEAVFSHMLAASFVFQAAVSGCKRIIIEIVTYL